MELAEQFLVAVFNRRLDMSRFLAPHAGAYIGITSPICRRVWRITEGGYVQSVSSLIDADACLVQVGDRWCVRGDAALLSALAQLWHHTDWPLVMSGIFPPRMAAHVLFWIGKVSTFLQQMLADRQSFERYCRDIRSLSAGVARLQRYTG